MPYTGHMNRRTDVLIAMSDVMRLRNGSATFLWLA